MRDPFPHVSQLLDGLHLGANTCRACIRTPANTGKYSWRIIYVLVSRQGVCLNRCEKWFEKRDKGSEEQSKTCPKEFKPLSCRIKIVHQHFSKSFSPPQICAQTKKLCFFTARLCRGSSEQVVGCHKEGHSGLEQMRVSLSKLDWTDLEIFRAI